MKEKGVTVNGKVIEDLGNRVFLVELDNGMKIKPYASPNLTRNHIRILVGDRVDVELSPYDLSNGRIVYRYK